MNNWFTIEKIDDTTYSISEYKHWEKSHSYLVIGSKQALLIDTGLGIDNIRKKVDNLTSLPIIVATTHVHWDHIGGHKHFNDIAVHELEKDWLNKFPLSLDNVKKQLLKEPFEYPNGFDINNYTIYKGNPSLILHDNDVIDLGNRKIKIIHTPGHSPGHICFYDLDNKYLFTGDLIYEGKLNAFYPTTNPIDFKNSVYKIKSLEINRILPGHYNLDVSNNLINKVWNALEIIEKEDNLKQKNVIYNFDKFSIHM